MSESEANTMSLNSLSNKGTAQNRKRVGRGMGSGNGKTAGRGHKGQKSRSGGGVSLGFEGGQMPLQRRVPKFGFKNINRVAYKGVNLDTIEALVETKKIKKELDHAAMLELRLATKNDLIKILGRGKLTQPVKIHAHKFSVSAKAAIEAAGGEAITL